MTTPRQRMTLDDPVDLLVLPATTGEPPELGGDMDPDDDEEGP